MDPTSENVFSKLTRLITIKNQRNHPFQEKNQNQRKVQNKKVKLAMIQN